MQLVVLGMHRSGTSSVTRLLDLAGAWFGPEGIATEANDENPRGFWERRDVREVCDGLLASTGHDWWNLAGFDPAALDSDRARAHLDAWEGIVANADAHGTWVVKEPRLCVLLPALAPALSDPVFVHVSREPVEVARSLHARDGLDPVGGVALWERYTVDAFSGSTGAKRILVRYEDVVADPVAATAGILEQLDDLGVTGLSPVADDEVLSFISPSLHRQRGERSERRDWMNPHQLDLAAHLDDGSILGPGAPGTISPGGSSTLSLLGEARRVGPLERRLADESRYLDIEVARRETIARRAVLALDDADRRLESYERSTVGRIARGLVDARQTVSPGHRRTRGAIELIRSDLEAHRQQIDAMGQLVRAPGSTSTVTFSTEHPLVRSTRFSRTGRTDRRKVAVLAWDVGHNPLGRANILAEMLNDHFDVELWGAQFDRYGNEVWAPLQGLTTELNVFPGSTFPEHLRTMRSVAPAIDADLVWVSKPRLPSYALGILAKQRRGIPLVLDVDDHELAFFGIDEGAALDDVVSRPLDELAWPFERAWTQACDPLIDAADLVTVSNVALQERYGGVIVPHARDQARFNPATADRAEVRARLGIPENERVLLFGGTPRIHKGVLDLLGALDRLGDDRYRLLMFGTRELDELRDRIGDLDRWARIVDPQPFAELPGLVAAADLSCVLQDPAHPVARYQMPAKVSDAMAMGVPCLVVPTPPLAPLIEADLLEVWQPDEPLHERIAHVFENHEDALARARRARRHFVDHLSYRSVGNEIAPQFAALIDDPPPLDPRLVDLVDAPARAFAGQGGIPRSARFGTRKPRRSSASTAANDASPVEVYDVVMFWKQNDSGLYGRRQDMFLEELQRSGRVGRIVHFDGPTSIEAVTRSYLDSMRHRADQRRLVAGETLARVLRRRDEPDVRRRTFLHGGRYSGRFGRPPRDAYADHALEVLAREGIGERPVILWGYPAHDDLPMLIDAVAPDVVVADLVDDNRTWYDATDRHVTRIEDNYRAVLARSDVVIANCEPVASAMEDFADDIEVVPNGLELPVPGAPKAPRPSFLRGIEGPVIGYVGNLSSRLDLDLIERLATERPSWQFVFVGSAHLDRSILDLERLGNVHFPGVVPYRRVRAFLDHVDVAIIPHVDNEMTRSMNPLKAFVYASAGVPAVSTPVANLVDVGELLTIAEGPEAFIAAIEDHLGRPRPEPDLDRLREHSWQRRVERVFELIDEVAVDP